MVVGAGIAGECGIGLPAVGPEQQMFAKWFCLSVGLRWGVMRRCNHYGSGVLLHPGIQSSPQGCPEGLQGLETPWTALPSASGQRAGRARGWRVLVATQNQTPIQVGILSPQDLTGLFCQGISGY